MARKVRPQNTPKQQVVDSDDSSSSSTVEDSSENHAIHYLINPYPVFYVPPPIFPVISNQDERAEQLLEDLQEKLGGNYVANPGGFASVFGSKQFKPDVSYMKLMEEIQEKMGGKYVAPPAGFASFSGSKQLKPKVIAIDPKATMEDKNNSNPKQAHQELKLQDVEDKPETENENQLKVELESKVKKTTSQLIEIEEIEHGNNLNILLKEKRFDSWRKVIQKTLSGTTNGNKGGESSAPIKNQEALDEEITKPKSDNSIDQTPSTSAPKEEEVKVIQETINPQLSYKAKKDNNKESEFLSTLNPRILVTPLSTLDTCTKPKPNLSTSSDKNNVLDIKNTPEFDTTKKKVMSTQDTLAMCTPKTGAVPKQPKNTGCEKQNDKSNKRSKSEKSTQADSKQHTSSETTNSNKQSNGTNVGIDHTSIINTICQAFEEARMLHDLSNQTSITAPSSGKVQPQVKAKVGIDYTPVVDVICKAVEGFKMLQTSSNHTSVTAASNGKAKAQVKAVDPRVNKGAKTAPKQFEEKYLLRDVTEKNKESKTSVVKPTDFKVIDEKEKHQQKASKATKKKDEIKGNKSSSDVTERKTKKKKSKDTGYLPPLCVTVPTTTYIQLRRRLDKEPLYQVTFGHVMINIYSEEELVNLQQYYDEYLDELLSKEKFNDSKDE